MVIIIYENTKNNNIEKKMAVFVFSDIFRNHPDMINIFNKLSHGYKFYLNIINEYLKSEFIPLKIKNVLKKMKISIQRKTEISK